MSVGQEVAVTVTRNPSASKESHRDRVRRFIVENFYVSDPSEVGDDVSLINTGLVDSTGMLEVIAFLESEFRIRVEESETIPANLETVGRIADYVARKQAARA
jgi:acyl carrier protein